MHGPSHGCRRNTQSTRTLLSGKQARSQCRLTRTQECQEAGWRVLLPLGISVSHPFLLPLSRVCSWAWAPGSPGEKSTPTPPPALVHFLLRYTPSKKIQGMFPII